MRFISACLVAILLFFIFTGAILAKQDYQFPQISAGDVQEALQGIVPIRFLPDNPLYFLISVKEAVGRFFQPSAVERSQFDFVLSGKRLKETYMLMEKGDYRRASSNLKRYAQRNGSAIGQIEKARAQNQAVEPAVSRMADDLRFQEKLLIATYDMRPADADSYYFYDSFSQGIDSFKALVGEIDNIVPGIKNRFQISKDIEASGSPVNPRPTPPTPVEATPTYRPRRIIY